MGEESLNSITRAFKCRFHTSSVRSLNSDSIPLLPQTAAALASDQSLADDVTSLCSQLLLERICNLTSEHPLPAILNIATSYGIWYFIVGLLHLRAQVIVSTGTPTDSSPSQERTKSRTGTGLLLAYLLDCYEGVNTEMRRYTKKGQVQYFSSCLLSCRSILVSHVSLLIQGCFQYLLSEETASQQGVELLADFLGLSVGDQPASIPMLPSGLLPELILHVFQVCLINSVFQSFYVNGLYFEGRRNGSVC